MHIGGDDRPSLHRKAAGGQPQILYQIDGQLVMGQITVHRYPVPILRGTCHLPVPHDTDTRLPVSFEPYVQYDNRF